MIYWLTGLPCSGKTTLGKRLGGVHLDGDILRRGVCGDLGFSVSDRDENINRVITLADWEHRKGNNVVCSFITPYERQRSWVKRRLANVRMIWVDCPLDVCIERDVKGMYKKALGGELPGFTGIGSPYNEPIDYDLRIDTSILGIEACVSRILEL